ncbi:hypothetical protein [Chryseobacterium sp.]|uniref:hypothetical protein n=1 Tax=Chryseobacterium sp. TaxID=1871047 RepID=UPI00289A5E4F|nr:hypothetical protein [Chryseobacterium sp.]
MKKITLLIGVLALSVNLYAQVGINTPLPQTSLDVVGNAASTSSKDGILAPRVTRQQLASKVAGNYAAAQVGALVYITDSTTPTGTTPSLAQTVEITGVGYYFFNGTVWKNVNDNAVNIYNSNGVLSGPRTVTTGGNQLNFNNASNSSVAIVTNATEGRLLASGANRGSLALSSGTSILNLFQDNAGVAQITTTGASTGMNLFTTNTTPLTLGTNNTARVSVTSAGNVGIGTTTPGHRLHVVSDAAAANRFNLMDADASTNQYGILALRNTSALATGNFSLLNFTNSGPTSGGGNWGIGSIRTGATVTTGAEEDFYFGNSLGGTLLERMRITSAGNVGIGTNAPARRFHVNANSAAVRFESLATLPTNTASTGLVIDANGDIYRNNTVSVEGQILRIGLNAATYAVGVEAGLRSNQNNTSALMANAPNGAPNFINTIVGATIASGVSVAAGQGSPARTTDQITLQPGTYKVQVRLVGNFASTSSANSVFLKSIVNNSEYSLVNFTNNSNQTTTYYFDDFINITGTAQTVDFTISPGTNTFTTASQQTPGTGNSYRSLILIQRLR